MIVLKVIAYSIITAVLGFFAVMSCILNAEEKEQRRQQGSTEYNSDKTCNSCENYEECLATDYKCRYEYQKYYKEKHK